MGPQRNEGPNAVLFIGQMQAAGRVRQPACDFLQVVLDLISIGVKVQLTT